MPFQNLVPQEKNCGFVSFMSWNLCQYHFRFTRRKHLTRCENFRTWDFGQQWQLCRRKCNWYNLFYGRIKIVYLCNRHSPFLNENCLLLNLLYYLMVRFSRSRSGTTCCCLGNCNQRTYWWSHKFAISWWGHWKPTGGVGSSYHR